MMDKVFLAQIKRTNGTIEKGIVIKNDLNAAKQGFYAYLGAYGYGHDANTDYVAVYIMTGDGMIINSVIDDRTEGE